jgi:hypothetical protein
MAPEQVHGYRLTGASDVWSSALVVFEALTRKNPYRSKSPIELAEKHRRLRLSLRRERPDLPAGTVRAIDAALDPNPEKRPSPGDLRDALLRGARAIEDGGTDEHDTEPPEPDAPLTLGRRRRHLRVVPDPIAPAAPRAERRQLPTLQVPALDALPLDRLWPPALTAIAASAILASLPFYPRGWALGLGLIAGLIAIRLPLLAAALVIALSLPLVGNHALALVFPVALAGTAWLLLLARDGRRALLPATAPLLALCFLWPAYLLLAGTSPRILARAALGAAGPIAIAVVFGLTGRPSPLGGETALNGLAAASAGADDVIATATQLGAAFGPTPVIQAAIWMALALTAPALFAARGQALAVAAGAWLTIGTVGTLLAPVAVGQAVGNPAAILVGAGATGILIAIRSLAATRRLAAGASGA